MLLPPPPPPPAVFAAARATLLRSRSCLLRLLPPLAMRTAAVRLNHAEAKPPVIFVGPGPIKGKPVSEWDIASGLERVELMAETEGIKLYDEEVFSTDRMGTLADPVVVKHWQEIANVQCTGVPQGSHFISWIPVHSPVGSGVVERCMVCGCCYQLDYKKKYAFVDPDTGKFTIKELHPDEFAKIEERIIEYAKALQEKQESERKHAKIEA